MAIVVTVPIVQAAEFMQGDIRDPLGMWGFRLGVTGDASGGAIKVTAFVPRIDASAWIYTCYSLTYAQLSGTPGGSQVKGRLLTNWPNIDPQEGIQGYATLRIAQAVNDADFTPPIEGVGGNQFLVAPNDRFILLYDPRSRSSDLDIIEMELGINVNAATYSFEGYGYFWDRSVLNAPGGLRHPGSA